VVAIIGILAALAVPAYQDYTIRSKVSEGASLASAARTAVDVYYSENGALTIDFDAANVHTSLGLSQAESYEAKYVESITVSGDGAPPTITVQLKTLTELGTASGGTFEYIPHNRGGNLEWTVSAEGATPIPTKYLPRR
jgi:type IV pilus assembly protein PilA